jgi:hypothetical protein
VDLEAEHSRSFEVGYDRAFANGFFGVTVFDTDYEELIAFGPTFAFENIDAASARGVSSRCPDEASLAVRCELHVAADGRRGDGRQAAAPARALRLGRVRLSRRQSHLAQLVVTHKGERGDVTDLLPFGTVTNEAYTTADVVVRYRMGALAPYLARDLWTALRRSVRLSERGTPCCGRTALGALRSHAPRGKGLVRMARLKTLLSWSSGKDSAWTLHRLRADDRYEVVGLLTTINAAHDRVAMHAVRMELLRLQAEAAGLPLWSVFIPSPCSNEEYEAAMGAAIEQAKAAGIACIAFGDLFLEDIRAYREEKLAPTGIAPLFPLWGADACARGREDRWRPARAGTCVDRA